MIELLVWRHAKTEHGGPARADRDRRLLAIGRADAAFVGSWLAEHELVPSVVLCSDSARTRESADVALERLRATPQRFDVPELYDAVADDYPSIVSIYSGGARRVLVVGHNPAVSEFVSRCAERSIRMKTGSLALIDAEVDRADELDGSAAMTLRRFLTPRKGKR